MINYIWIGLIVVAIVYGAFLELFTDKKPVEVIPAVEVESFEEDVEWGGVFVDGTAWNPDVAEEAAGRSLQWDWSLDEQRDAELGASLPIEKQTYTNEDGREASRTPESVSFRLQGDGGGNILKARITDADGEQFTAGLGRIGDQEDWKQITLGFGALTPAPVNPEASADFPLELSALVLAASARAENQSGILFIDAFELNFANESRLGFDAETESWMGVLTASAARWAEISISLAIDLIGIMMLWLGLMRIAEKAGLVQALAKLLKPIMVLLFPDIPANSPAMGAILMNIAANMLGLGNAATPLGIKAMKEMQKLNPYRDYASNAQCMLLAINTSSVTLISATVIGYRVAAGSQNIMIFWPMMLIATFAATTVAIVSCKFFEKMPIFAIPADAAPNEEFGQEEKD